MPLKAATGAVLGGGVPGGAGPYVTGPARPKAATPGNRGPAVARGGADRKAPSGRLTNALGASRRSIPLWGNGKRDKGAPRASNNRGASARLKFLSPVHNERAWKPSTPT